MSTFIELLRRLINVLGPFSEPSHAGSKIWDGTAYVSAAQRSFDPFAAKWWATLTAIAEMLDKQGAPPSPEQKAYLDRLLFGGMGSLNDFVLDERQLGVEARQANQELNRLRKELFEQFRRISV
jgi:hypothetical protein